MMFKEKGGNKAASKVLTGTGIVLGTGTCVLYTVMGSVGL